MLAYEDFEADEELDLDRVVDTEYNKSDLIKQFGDGKSVIGGQQFKKRLSPRPGSPNQNSRNSPRGGLKASASNGGISSTSFIKAGNTRI